MITTQFFKKTFFLLGMILGLLNSNKSLAQLRNGEEICFTHPSLLRSEFQFTLRRNQAKCQENEHKLKVKRLSNGVLLFLPLSSELSETKSAQTKEPSGSESQASPLNK